MIDNEAVRKHADHLGFTMIRGDGVYRLYSRYPDNKGATVCKTKTLTGITRFLHRWSRKELAVQPSNMDPAVS
jgi:hypothetical protein